MTVLLLDAGGYATLARRITTAKRDICGTSANALLIKPRHWLQTRFAVDKYAQRRIEDMSLHS